MLGRLEMLHLKNIKFKVGKVFSLKKNQPFLQT